MTMRTVKVNTGEETMERERERLKNKVQVVQSGQGVVSSRENVMLKTFALDLILFCQ